MTTGGNESQKEREENIGTGGMTPSKGEGSEKEKEGGEERQEEL